MKKDLSLFGVFTVIAILSRLVSHTANFTLVGAMAVLAGIFISRKTLAFCVPLVALLVSDLFFQAYNNMIYVYLGFMAMVFIGSLFRKSYFQVIFGSMIASAMFFFISNFGVWSEGVLYPKTMNGFINCYLMAIPFMKNEMLSTTLGVAVGSFILVKILKINFSAIALKSL